MSKIVVTGSNGFIGGYIVSALRESGASVIGIDISKVAKIPCDKYLTGDISSDFLCGKNVIDMCKGADVIVHVAALKNTDTFNVSVVNTNIIGTLNVFKLCKEINCKNIVYISSVPVIGKPRNRIITTDVREHPRTLYHITKLVGEYIFDLPEASDINTCTLRIPSPIGVGMPPTFLSVLINRALKNEKIELYGKGTRRQNYIDVRDIARAVCVCIEKGARGVYNIGAESTISNSELAELCIKNLGSVSEVTYNGVFDTADDEDWNIDIMPAKRDFGFETKYGIADTINWIAKGTHI